MSQTTFWTFTPTNLPVHPKTKTVCLNSKVLRAFSAALALFVKIVRLLLKIPYTFSYL